MPDRDLIVDQHLGLRRVFTCVGARVRLRGIARALDHILDHRDEAQVHAVVRMVDAFDAVALQLGDFLGRDGATAAAKYLDMGRTTVSKHVDHVLEILDVAALVRTERDRVGVFLQRGAHDVLDAAVVAQMDHLGALRLDQAAHDVDRRVVAVEQARRGDEAQRRRFGRQIGDGRAGRRRTHGGYSGSQRSAYSTRWRSLEGDSAIGWQRRRHAR